ncbi:MAG: PASTA domain-containing protein [Betaproteobacteria bacterium]
MDAADPRDPENGSGQEPQPASPAEPGSAGTAGAGGGAGAAGDTRESAEPDVDEPHGEAGEWAGVPDTGAETVEQPRAGDTPPGPGTEPVDPWSGSAETIYGGVEPVSAGETGPTGTGVLPAVPAGPPEPPESPRWFARAQVPTPGSGGAEYEAADWDGRERPPRSVMPALIALAIVLLLAIIGFGLWLALHNKNAPTTPITTPPTQATTRPQTTAPTTAPPTTTPPPTTAPPTTAPALIPVPNVVGDDLATAQAKLTQAGLKVGTQTNQSSPTAPAGTVISQDPGEGFKLPAGQSVNLVVSTGPPATATPTPSTS